MKFSRGFIKTIVEFIDNKSKRKSKRIPFASQKENRYDISYLNDSNELHKFDIYYALDNRLNKTLLDIHGGAYILGEHIDNYPFAFEMLKEGFDVVLLDYEPNNGKKDTMDIINDCASNLRHLYQNLVKYGLDQDKIVLCGDSAGGHLALLFTEASN